MTRWVAKLMVRAMPGVEPCAVGVCDRMLGRGGRGSLTVRDRATGEGSIGATSGDMLWVSAVASGRSGGNCKLDCRKGQPPLLDIVATAVESERSGGSCELDCWNGQPPLLTVAVSGGGGGGEQLAQREMRPHCPPEKTGYSHCGHHDEASLSILTTRFGSTSARLSPVLSLLGTLILTTDPTLSSSTCVRTRCFWLAHVCSFSIVSEEGFTKEHV